MRRQGSQLRGGDGQERGAVAVMTAGLMVVVLAVAALAVDLGMQRVVRSDMQALADVVALDAARLLDGRTAQDVRAGSDGLPSLQATVDASAQRNESTLGDVVSVVPTLVYLDSDANGANVPRRSGGVLVPVADTAVPDAVLVAATGDVDFAFAPGSGAATRTAIGTASSYGCFRLGSFAAALSSNDAALAEVFESLVGDALGFNLGAVGYEGLLTSSIGIADLAAELGAGTPTELATLPSLTVAQLLSASAVVLNKQGDVAASAILADISTKVTQTLALDIDQLLTVGNGSALEGEINALDLLGSAGLAASAVVANGNNFLDTGVAWSAPHVSSGDITLQAIAAPAHYCGPIGGGTSTAQVEFNSSFGFSLPNKVTVTGLGSLSVGTQDDPTLTKATMTINASLAGATGTLAGVTCGDGTAASPQVTEVNVDTNLLSTTVSLPFRARGTLDVTASDLVPISLVESLFGILATDATVSLTLDLKGSATAALSTQPTTASAPTKYSVPPLTYGEALASTNSGSHVSLATPEVVLDTSVSVSIRVVSKLLGVVIKDETKTAQASQLNLGALVSALTASTIGTSTATVVGNVNDALVPVAELLGIRLAGADVIGTFAPSCSQPALAG